jgi:hypothetical protein
VNQFVNVREHATGLRFRDAASGGVFPFEGKGHRLLAVGEGGAALRTPAIREAEASEPKR